MGSEENYKRSYIANVSEKKSSRARRCEDNQSKEIINSDVDSNASNESLTSSSPSSSSSSFSSSSLKDNYKSRVTHISKLRHISRSSSNSVPCERKQSVYELKKKNKSEPCDETSVDSESKLQNKRLSGKNDVAEEQQTEHFKHFRRSSDDERSSHRLRSSESNSRQDFSRYEKRWSQCHRKARHSDQRPRLPEDGKASRNSVERYSSKRLSYYRSSSRDHYFKRYRNYRRSPTSYRASFSRGRYREMESRRKRSLSRSRRRSEARHRRSTSRRRHLYRSTSRRRSLTSRSSSPRKKCKEDVKKQEKSKENLKESSAQEVAKPVKKSKWDVPISASADLDGKIGLLAIDPNKRLYITNLPPDIMDSSLVQFLNGALIAASGVDFTTAALTGFFPVSKVQLIADQHYALVDLRTSADVNVCLQLDGILFNGHALKISRSTDVILPRPPEDVRASESSNGVNRGASDVKVYVTDLPVTVTDQELRAICSRYGGVRSVALMKDLKTAQSMGCGVVEFDSPASANAAVKALDRKPMGLKIPRFHKGLMLPGLSRFSETGERLAHTSAIVTELPTSVTYKIFSNAIVGAQVRASRQEGAKPSLVVQLLNAVFPEDLIKDDEYKAIVEDMRNEASQYGTLINVVIPRPPEDLSFKPGVGKVFMHFSDITAARRAQAELNGRRYDQRRTICAAFYSLDRFLQGKYTLV